MKVSISMKKIPLLIAFFIIALIAGFVFADVMGLFQDEKSNDSKLSQVNYLLIRVDDLTRPKPALHTVWGIFSSFSGQPSIYFQPIYPSSNIKVDLRSLFSLDQSGKPNDPFLKELEKFNLDFDGYLILDDKGTLTFLDWLAPSGTTKPSATGVASTSQLSSQRTLLEQVCKGLSTSYYHSHQPFKWELVFPAHLVSSTNIETVIPLFDRVFFTSSKVECHVLD